MLIHSGHFCVRLTRSFQFQAATVDISRISFWEIPNKWMDSSLCQHCISRHRTHMYVLFVCLLFCLFVCSRVQAHMFRSHGCLQIWNIPSEWPSEVWSVGDLTQQLWVWNDMRLRLFIIPSTQFWLIWSIASGQMHSTTECPRCTLHMWLITLWPLGMSQTGTL